ncbi:plasmid transfer protein TraB [Streptomyces phytophilus]|uniref:plasmid transfer protein TraB n=1 Tax=Streptomyces phytophilus TaxID=722715 RepID=UPI0015EFF21C|nr:plasmid transfer protein TraB [Streptomyces phytophilus]
MADTLRNDAWKGAKSPHARPWIAVASQVPATFAANQAWGGSPLAAVGITVASMALTGATWWAGRDTSAQRRLHATATTAVATGYFTVATYSDPLGGTQLSWLAIGGATLAASWNVRKTLRTNPDKQQGEQQAGETGVLVKSLGKAKAKLRGEPTVEPNKVTAPYQLAPGEMTNADLSSRVNQIASELGISPNSIRIMADPENAAQGEMVFVPKDMLTEGTPWPGPSAFGGSITDAVVVGIYEDGDPEQFWFPADEDGDRNATHFGAFGMNGSGKSAGITTAIVEALTRTDVIVWAADPAKGQQTFGPLLPWLDWVEMSEAGGEAMIDALSQVITARANELGRHGFKNWTPAAHAKLGMPYMIVWIEEAGRFFRNGTEMEGLVMEARSAGISVIISLQRPSASSMPTDVREQLGGVMCFGVKGATTADMALPDDVRDAGARPEAWEGRKRGYNYLVAPGVDEERYAMKARTFTPPSDQMIVEVLAAAPPVDAGPTTANAAGEAYANRAIYLPDDEQQQTEGVTMTKEQHDEQRQADEDTLLARQVERDIAARLGDDGDIADLQGVDPDREIPPVPAGQRWVFAEPEPEPATKPTTEEAVARLHALLDELREAGHEFVGPRHFKPHGAKGRYGRSRGWLSDQLNNLADEGVHLEDVEDAEPGTYRLLYPELTPA